MELGWKVYEVENGVLEWKIHEVKKWGWNGLITTLLTLTPNLI